MLQPFFFKVGPHAAVGMMMTMIIKIVVIIITVT